jgi:hypothetical protein
MNSRAARLSPKHTHTARLTLHATHTHTHSGAARLSPQDTRTHHTFRVSLSLCLCVCLLACQLFSLSLPFTPSLSSALSSLGVRVFVGSLFDSSFSRPVSVCLWTDVLTSLSYRLTRGIMCLCLGGVSSLAVSFFVGSHAGLSLSLFSLSLS